MKSLICTFQKYRCKWRFSKSSGCANGIQRCIPTKFVFPIFFFNNILFSSSQVCQPQSCYLALKAPHLHPFRTSRGFDCQLALNPSANICTRFLSIAFQLLPLMMMCMWMSIMISSRIEWTHLTMFITPD